MSYKIVQLYDKNGDKISSVNGPRGSIGNDNVSTTSGKGYLFGRITFSEVNNDIYIRIKVIQTYGQMTSGILTCHIRTDGSGTISSYDFYWESKVNWRRSPNDFICCKSANNILDLYITNMQRWEFIVFEILDCGDKYSKSRLSNIQLYTRNSETEVTLPTSNIKKSIYPIYPVGGIYMSTDGTNPTQYFGGTWEQIQGRFLLGQSGSYAVNTTGGEINHTLTVPEMPHHNHFGATGVGKVNNMMRTVHAAGGAISHNHVTGYSSAPYTDTGHGGTHFPGSSHYHDIPWDGEGKAHNNMPPYYTVYIWKRTA